MTARLKSGNQVVGAKQVKRALKTSDVELVYIAEDAEEKVTVDIIELCNEKHIPIVQIETMKILGDACGISINAAVAALIRQ
ncbi:MAG: 50S ribosomal protein L7ae-like protein [Tissierellia bacterium]|nr:50S ribosomal protein L7ae-like protein [Tissierellia bacterium]